MTEIMSLQTLLNEFTNARSDKDRRKFQEIETVLSEGKTENWHSGTAIR